MRLETSIRESAKAMRRSGVVRSARLRLRGALTERTAPACDLPNDSGTRSITCQLFGGDQRRERERRGQVLRASAHPFACTFRSRSKRSGSRCTQAFNGVCQIEKVCYIAQLPAGAHNPAGSKKQVAGGQGKVNGFSLHRPRKTNDFQYVSRAQRPKAAADGSIRLHGNLYNLEA